MAGDSTKKDRDDQPVNPDATGEFFSVGMPLHAVRAGYIRRRADDQLYDAVAAGRYAHVVAPDRSGKSSLVAATAARLESNGHKVAILDLAQIGDRDGGTDSARWYYSVAYRLLRQLRIRYDLQTWWQDKTILSNRQRLSDFYSEVILQHIEGSVAVFVDEIQCIEDLPYADQLLASIRAAHNARTTDPDFSRLCFVLLGECDPVSLVQEAEASPFNVTQQVLLDDFSRADLVLFSTELNLGQENAEVALDRIHYWTDGQPYLSQKLARAVAREASSDDIEALVDRVARTQLAGRAALHSEPHMSHIHRAIVNDDKRCEPLLNLYGKIRKGITVPADLGSALQRRLMAVGLLVIDTDSNLKVRNRLYESVFTARWANENLPIRLRVPAIVAGVLLLATLIPFWYTQWLPNPYVRTLASDDVELPIALTAYDNLRSFPGHTGTADNLFRGFLERRALASEDEQQIREVVALAAELPDTGRLAEKFEAGFWDRRSSQAAREEDRDAALLASIQSLVLATPQRRRRAASLVADDYPYLLNTLPAVSSDTAVFDSAGMVMTTATGANVSQFSYAQQGMQVRDPWAMTALEVSPLVRRVIVDRQGAVSRIGLTLNISHARLADLRIKVIGPSGRAVEIEPGLERASSNDDIRIPAGQLADLLGESLSGTWTISVRDESLGVAGQLVGWNLKLNSQGAVEHFQRGLNIPDPLERETDSIWFDPSGRYAVARATQSDSARIWDLAFAEPVRAIALPESEVLIGIDAGARRLVTASQDKIGLWNMSTGDKVDTLAVGAASSTATLTTDRSQLFALQRGDIESRLELWDLDAGRIAAQIVVAGVPAVVAIDATGSRVAIADFDRAVRVWDFRTQELLGQFDLPAQPGAVHLSADGSRLGIVYPNIGVSLWDVANPKRPLVEEFGSGHWQLSFSPSGNRVAAGRAETGFQLYGSAAGDRVGPRIGLRKAGSAPDMLTFSQDEQLILTGSADSARRVWRAPGPGIDAGTASVPQNHSVWTQAADRVLDVAPDGKFTAIGDPDGHVHFVATDATIEDLLTVSEGVSYVGHSGNVRLLEIDPTGRFAASVDAGNTLKLWRAATGEPLPFTAHISGLPVSHVAFSPGAEFVAALSGTQVTLVDASDGRIVAEFASGSLYSGLTFVAEDRLYLGAEDGALQLVSRASDNNWSIRQVWQGPQSIRLLGAPPEGDYLILVDRNNLASKFFLVDGRIGDRTLQLPSAVEEVAFGGNGTRAYFRTVRWVHRANASLSGLTWIDALLVPPGLNGAGIVRGNGTTQGADGGKMFLPVANNDYIELFELSFGGNEVTGLFGNRSELLQEWRARVTATHPEGF